MKTQIAIVKNKMDGVLVFESLKGYIFSKLSQSGDLTSIPDQSHSLVHWLSEVSPLVDDDPACADFNEHFPKTVLNKHAYDTYIYLKELYNI